VLVKDAKGKENGCLKLKFKGAKVETS